MLTGLGDADREFCRELVLEVLAGSPVSILVLCLLDKRRFSVGFK